jgi:tetratricopeptide (TPR) repeat protein
MIEKEILPNNATHPTLKIRLETLGVEDVDAIEYPRDSAYADEIQKVLDFADKKLIELHDTYEQDRREQYLEPLERITKWKESGEPIAAETYADIIADLHRLGRYEDAERLCERVIEELDEYSSYHAYFIKGCAMLYRYEEAGVDLIYHALEGNQNYLENGLNVIGEFFCMTGREQELLDYRARAAQLSQQDKDEFSQTSFLSKNDKLSRDEMPKEMLEEILGYIRSVDCDIIQKIYLVRKTVSETYFASAFVIHFYGGTDAQREDIMHKIFRYLDTYPVDWHFALFDYFDYPDIKFDKIEGSLVYSKNNNKGEKK